MYDYNTKNDTTLIPKDVAGLVEFNKKWFKVPKGSRVWPNTVYILDSVVETKNGEVFIVIKDSSSEDIYERLKLLILKLWANGKTLSNLPEFVDKGYDEYILRYNTTGDLIMLHPSESNGYDIVYRTAIL